LKPPNNTEQHCFLSIHINRIGYRELRCRAEARCGSGAMRAARCVSSKNAPQASPSATAVIRHCSTNYL
jgi:hypothetical protein